MHQNKKTNNEKIDKTLTWNVRWSASDANSLTRAATYLIGHGEPAIQSRAWPQQMVRLGLCEELSIKAPIEGARKIFLPTKAARALLANNYPAHQISTSIDPARIAHKLLIQRVALDIIHYVRINNGILTKYYTESEISGLNTIEFLERWPDAILEFKMHNGMIRTVAIEIERSSRSSTRLKKMAAGLAEIINPEHERYQIFHSVAVFVPSDGVAMRYRKFMSTGVEYTRHERRGTDYIEYAGIKIYPAGVEVISGYSATIQELERITRAVAHTKPPAKLTKEQLQEISLNI